MKHQIPTPPFSNFHGKMFSDIEGKRRKKERERERERKRERERERMGILNI